MRRVEPISREFWMPDSSAKQCSNCEKKFNTFRRKHHCRMCGLIFCKQCNSYKIPINENKFICKCCAKCTQLFTRPASASPKHMDEDEEEFKMLHKTSSLGRVESEAEETMPERISTEELSLLRGRINLPPSSFFLNSRCRQLLESYDLKLSWNDLLVEMALTAVNTVWPSVKYRRDKPDITQYVRVLEVDWEDHSLSAYYSGVIFKRNVAHRKMRTVIENPKILLLSGGAEFCSTEVKLISMDTVLNQEAEFNRILVKKITSIKPEIVLVEKGMSQTVLEELTQRNITTVLNVKERHLNMVARCTNSQVMTSVDQISTAANAVGTCGQFSVKKWGKNTYIMLNECPDLMMGATILLSGPNRHELATVKTVLKRMLLDYRDYILEHNFFNQCGLDLQPIEVRPIKANVIALQICNKRPCEAPQEMKVDFYSSEDIPLGQYIGRAVQSADDMCKNWLPQGQHKTYFVSYKGVVRVKVISPSAERSPIESLEFTRICKDCGDRSVNFLLNIASWELSFYHFIYLFLTLHDVTTCGHSFFKRSNILISTKSSIVKFKWFEANIYDLMPLAPCRSITGITETSIEELLHEVHEAAMHCFDKVHSKAKELYEETAEGERNCAEENKESWELFNFEILSLCNDIKTEAESISRQQAGHLTNLLEVETLRRSSFYKFIDFAGTLDKLFVSVANLKLQSDPSAGLSLVRQDSNLFKTLDLIGPRSDSTEKTSNETEEHEAPSQQETESPSKINMDVNKWDFLTRGQLSLPLGVSKLAIPVDEYDLFSLITYALDSDDYKTCVIEPTSPRDAFQNFYESELLTEKAAHLRVKATSFTATEGVGTIKQHTAIYGEPLEFTVKVYFVRQFHALRMHLTGSNVEYLNSIHKSAGKTKVLGKSGAGFTFSHDGKYLIKEFSDMKEVKMFLEMAPSYFRHVCKSLCHDMPSRMVHTLGFYKISTKNLTTGFRKASFVFVLENTGFNLPEPRKVYDLKGTLNPKRFVEAGASKTKMDVNFVDERDGLPLFLSMNSKHSLESAIHNDTQYLAKQNVMDYSMLVMFNPKERLLAAAIIDYSGQYNFEKVVESTFKQVVGSVEPTVINPEGYKLRFRKTMTEVFFIGVSEDTP